MNNKRWAINGFSDSSPGFPVFQRGDEIGVPRFCRKKPGKACRTPAEKLRAHTRRCLCVRCIPAKSLRYGYPKPDASAKTGGLPTTAAARFIAVFSRVTPSPPLAPASPHQQKPALSAMDVTCVPGDMAVPARVRNINR